MRIALISPYSWTYPGGVTGHVEALARELGTAGHRATILAPVDPDDRRALRSHLGVQPQRREPPERFVSLGRTIGIKANGAVSNLALSSESLLSLRRELRTGGYDIVHLHEPVAPLVCWDALGCTRLPLVGTYHTYSENLLTNGAAGWVLGGRRRMRRLRVRIAVSEAAAYTARRFYGGKYRIIPNGVAISPPAGGPPASTLPRLDGSLRIACVAQPVPRKGIPVLLRAFQTVRERTPATLTLIGASAADVGPSLAGLTGVRALGRVSDEVKRAELRAADVLCAPSLYGESFGMVLTEAFAETTPVVASDIPGYRDVARDGVEGILVNPGDPWSLADALCRLAANPAWRRSLGVAARHRAEEFAWSRVASQVLTAYEDALAMPTRRRVTLGIARQRSSSRASLQPALNTTDPS